MDIREKMLERAQREYHPEDVSPFVYAHHVVAAVESENGEIYTGFCVEACGGSGMPCGACREFLLQLNAGNADTEIMLDYDTRETVKLIDLMPNWWGWERYEEEAKTM